VQRVPEPELMDTDEQARAYSEADFSEPHDRFVAAFRARFPGVEVSGAVLDLGCGPADVTVRFARAFPRCHIDGLDGAEAMLRYGRERVARAGLEARVTLVHARLPEGTPPRQAYDAVVSNSLLHHLRDAATLWRAVKRYGAAGAPVFIMDLMRPSDAAAASALVEAHAADAPDVLREDFHASLLAAYTPEEVRAQLARHGLSHLEVVAETDRHLVVYGQL
jgi:ubiquinone/menaquinone biosynthesis C-methylase UbiE